MSGVTDKPGGVDCEVIDPVARLAIDSPLPHLDRAFDYLVPPSLAAAVQVGSRVRVRFAGRLTDAWVLARRADTDHIGRLTPIDRVVGDVPVLTAATTALFRAVADRGAGTFADVVRLGVPTRHARAETPLVRPDKPPGPAAPPTPPEQGLSSPGGWSGYHSGGAFLAAVAARRPARAVWSALPGEGWPSRLAEVVASAVRGGRGAIVVVPDARDLARLEQAVTARVGAGAVVALAADLGPQRRYRRWLAVRRGDVRVVIGTRAAAYAPVADLGLVVVWDDGDDLHAEPRAPYPHVRDVLAVRSSLEGAALLVGGYCRTAEAQLLVQTGWAHEIMADRAQVRVTCPRIVAVGDEAELARDPAARTARLPSVAWRAARAALAGGRPVLVQVPRRGYAPVVACVRDRTPARCGDCHGPLAVTGRDMAPTCAWCARPAGGWRCPACGGSALRAVVVGSRRTAEELGRAFPGVPVRTSGSGEVLDAVEQAPALVIATPGAEPVVAGGYGAALLLDGWALLGRPDLRAGEEALRRWVNAVALVAPGGQVVVAADAAVPTVQALVRWDPAGHAERELADRAELGFPPAVRMALLTGPGPAVADLVAHARWPAGCELIGPVGAGPAAVRMLARVPRQLGGELATCLKAAASVRSARKSAGAVRIELDPQRLG